MTITDVDIITPALVGGDTAPAGGWKPGDGENKEGDSSLKRICKYIYISLQRAISNSGAYKRYI